MIDKGMDNEASLKGLMLSLIINCSKSIRWKPALTPDANAKYFAEVVIDLDIVAEPMIADQT
jgi:aconitate hydratase 2/2-methylisocitrate dehydratase